MILHNLLPSIERPPYLFLIRQVFSMGAVFGRIQSGMWMLNDFCYLCTEAATGKLAEVYNGIANQKPVDIDGVRVFDENQFLARLNAPLWHEAQGYVAAGMCHIMLAAFLEKSLKEVIAEAKPVGAGQPKRGKGQSQVDSYLAYLRDVCSLTFEVPAETRKVMELHKKLRNDFAHGDWDVFQKKLTGIDLPMAFDAVSALLRVLEVAYIDLYGSRDHRRMAGS